MARTCGSLVDTNLPIFALKKVGCINWGLVAGKTNTIFAWQDVNNPMNRVIPTEEECREPELWFHDLFRPDGTPYNQAEIDVFQQYAAIRALSEANKTLHQTA
jgi:hypothetical protein